MGSVDQRVLERLRGLKGPGGDDILQLAIDVYLDETPKRLSEMRDAAMRGDFGVLVRHAHALAGASLNIGAGHMAELCGEIWSRASAENDDVGDLLSAVEEELRSVIGELQADRGG